MSPLDPICAEGLIEGIALAAIAGPACALAAAIKPVKKNVGVAIFRTILTNLISI
jgi:hypothetical protein